jgi:cell division protein FtsZ
MVFVTAGLAGHGGCAPIAAAWLKLGSLTVAVVTKPFAFEGRRRMMQAEQGLAELSEVVDTVICIPNERLMQFVDKGTSFFEAFRIADDILPPGRREYPILLPLQVLSIETSRTSKPS